MKNKEPLILAVVIVFTLVVYYLVEPFAHSQMHKHVESEGFAYSDLPALSKKGDVTRGKDLVLGAGACIGCHSLQIEGMPAPMDAVNAAAAYGVNPPDLSFVGSVYDAKFLTDLIKNPAHALNVEHKFDMNKGQMHPMVPFYGAGGDIDQEIADMVAYLQSAAEKSEKRLTVVAGEQAAVSAEKAELSEEATAEHVKESITKAQNQVAFEIACGRCHAVKYEKWTQVGTKPTFKKKQDDLAFDMSVLDYQDSLTKYMGKLPPDLSMYIRSRGEHFISTLVENPQSHLEGTAMPRVGVTQESMDKVIEYLEDAGDTKRHERESVGVNVMLYMLLFVVFAILWKKQVWRDLH